MKIRRLLIYGLCALAAGLTLRFSMEKFSLFGSIAGYTVPLKEPIPAYTRALRPNYPYSVIAGGAYSAIELQYADREDPVVKEHYADFDMKRVQMVKLTHDKYQYASYRLKKKIYWTKKKLRIPKGEVLLTDGASWARARCGNRLSEKRHLQISPEEPTAKALSLPPMELGAPMELAEAPPLGELSSIPPVNFRGTQPVMPSSGGVAPPEMPPIVPMVPITPVIPPVFVTPTPPTSPPTTPPTNPPVTPPIIPPNTPPVSTVPEPKAVYLFLISFVLSLYGLTRMMPSRVQNDAADRDERPGSGEPPL